MTARILLLIATLFILAFPTAQAEVKPTASRSQSLQALPMGGLVPRPGALSVSPDGSIAAHIKSNGDVLIWDVVTGKTLDTIVTAGKRPSALALGPDTDQIAIGYVDAQVVLLSRKTHKSLREFKGHLSEITALAFSPDGQVLVSGATDATTQVWLLSSGRRLHVFDSTWNGDISGDAGYPVAFGFTGDGQVLAVNEWHSGYYDVGRSSSLWDLGSGMEISSRELSPPSTDNFMRAGQALGGQNWLLTYTGTQHLMIERLDRCEKPQPLQAEAYADTVAVDPRGRWVATTAPDKITFFAPDSKGKGITIPLPTKAIALAPLPDGRTLLAILVKGTRANGNENYVVGRDGETVTQGALYRIAVPETLLQRAAFAVPEGTTHCPLTEAMRAPQDFQLPENPLELRPIARHTLAAHYTTLYAPDIENELSGIAELRFSADGRLFALYSEESSRQKSIATWDPKTGLLLQSRILKGYSGDHPLSLPEGWAYASDKEVINLLTGKTIVRLAPTQLNASTDIETGDIFLRRDDGIDRFNSDGKRLMSIRIKGKVHDLAARNGRLVVLHGVRENNATISLWNLQSNEKPRIFRITNEDAISYTEYGLELSADGSFLTVRYAVPDGDGPDWDIVYRLSAGKADPVVRETLLSGFPRRANRSVVGDARVNRVAVWDYGKGKIIARPPRQRSRDKEGIFRAQVAILSDDGQLLAYASRDGLVRIWDLETHKMLGEARTDSVVTALAFDQSGKQLAVGMEDGLLLVFQVSGAR